jgi:hypothetical protein
MAKHKETVSEHVDRISTMASLIFEEECRHRLAVRELRDKYDPGWFEREAHEFALKHPDLVSCLAPVVARLRGKRIPASFFAEAAKFAKAVRK